MVTRCVVTTATATVDKGNGFRTKLLIDDILMNNVMSFCTCVSIRHFLDAPDVCTLSSTCTDHTYGNVTDAGFTMEMAVKRQRLLGVPECDKFHDVPRILHIDYRLYTSCQYLYFASP